MDKRSDIENIKSGFRIVGHVFLIVGWLILALGGMDIAFTPTNRPPLVGWVSMLVAALILLATMNRWVRVFPGILAYAAFGGVLLTIRGHLAHRPEILVPRSYGVITTLTLLASAVVASTIARRPLRVIDRAALLIFVACILAAMLWGQTPTPFWLMVIGTGFLGLVAAWGYDRFQRLRKPKKRSTRRNVSQAEWSAMFRRTIERFREFYHREDDLLIPEGLNFDAELQAKRACRTEVIVFAVCLVVIVAVLTWAYLGSS